MKQVISRCVRHPISLLLIAAVLALAAYTFLLHPKDLRSAAGLSGVEAEEVASVTVTFPHPGYARSEDPALIARGLELLESTSISRRSYGQLLSLGGGNPYTISFTLADGSTIALREVQKKFVFDREEFIAGLLAITDGCETKDGYPTVSPDP